jgi:hypothetical protein
MPIPTDASGESLFARKPDLQRYTALTRFSRMSEEVSGKMEAPDLSASDSLKSKVHVFDPARDGDAFRAPALPATGIASPVSAAVVKPELAASPAAPAPRLPSASVAQEEFHHDGEPPAAPLFPPNTSAVIVQGNVRAGDVVTVTGAPEGEVALAGEPLDRGVLGIVGGQPGASWTGRAPLVLSGVVAFCNVDATGGAIAVGDLLVSSSTPGHAARAPETPAPGTVIAKALESLEAGTATLRVLVLSR